MRARLLFASLLFPCLMGCGGEVTISLTEADLQAGVDRYFPIHSKDYIEQELPVDVVLTDPKLTLTEGSDRITMSVNVAGEAAEGAPDASLPGVETPSPPTVDDEKTPPVRPGPPGLPRPGGSIAPSRAPQPPALGDGPLSRRAPPKELNGSITASGKVSYNAEQGAFYLLEPTVDEVSLENLPTRDGGPVKQAAAAVLKKYFAQNAVYTLADDDTKMKAAKMLLKSVTVENAKLKITLGP